MCKKVSIWCAVLLAAAFIRSAAAGNLLEITWTGNGDGTTWEDPQNWDLNIAPNAASHVAVFDALPGEIILDGRLGPEITIGDLRVNRYPDVFVLTGVASGTRFTLGEQPCKDDLPDMTFDNSTVNVDVAVNIDLGPGDDTFTIDLSSTEQFGFSNVTFMQPITTNDNDLIIMTEDTDTALFRMDDDFADGNSGDVSIDGTVAVGVDSALSADVLNVTDGDITITDTAGQLNVNSVRLNRGSLNLPGDATPTNPLPNLGNNIESSGGRVALFGEQMTVPAGLTLNLGNTTVDVRDARVVKADFNGTLTRSAGGTATFRTNASSTIEFDNVAGVDPNGVIPYALINDFNFPRYDDTTGEVSELLTYTPLSTASPGDAAQAVGNTVLDSDADVSVLKINNGNIDGGGNTITTDAILVKGVSANISNATIMPHHQPGNVVNDLITHAPVGGDRLSLTADIADNVLPTEWTINSPQAGRVTVNTSLSKTGDTNILGGTVILNGQDADLGGDRIKLGAGASVVLVDNNISQDFLIGTGPFPAQISADGASVVSGDVTIEVDSRNDRAFRFTGSNSDDSLTINGTVTRGGSGNPIEGQGKAIVQLGSSFGQGDIIVNGDLSDPNLQIVLDGANQRKITVNGQLGSTIVKGSVELNSLDALLRDIMDNLSDVGLEKFLGISPGQSLGTITVIDDMLMRNITLTYNAEVDEAGNSDLIAVGGTLDLTTPNDTLDITYFTGSTLAGADYTLATYGELVGAFDAVMFDGSPVADPSAPGAIGGTHRLQYRSDALLLTATGPIEGDFDDDGDVDGDDVLLIQANDASLIALWQEKYGATAPQQTVASAVPEPSSALLLIVAGNMLRARRKSRRTIPPRR